MSRSTAFLAAAIFMPAAMPALADTRIEYVDERTGEPRTVISVKDGDVRIDDADGSGYTLFRDADRTLVFVDNKEKTYTRMDEAAMDQTSGQIGEAMAEMRKQLEQMPSEQREMMERMMGGAQNAAKSMFEVTVDRTGKIMRKAGHDCEQVFFSIGTVARTELCVVEPEEIRMPANDRRALDTMQAQMKKFAEKMSQGAGVNFTFDFESMGGMPVYMKEQRQRAAEVLRDVSQDGLDAALFRIPENYREENMKME